MGERRMQTDTKQSNNISIGGGDRTVRPNRGGAKTEALLCVLRLLLACSTGKDIALSLI